MPEHQSSSLALTLLEKLVGIALPVRQGKTRLVANSKTNQGPSWFQTKALRTHFQ